MYNVLKSLQFYCNYGEDLNKVSGLNLATGDNTSIKIVSDKNAIGTAVGITGVVLNGSDLSFRTLSNVQEVAGFPNQHPIRQT